jgi:hypothetical protein
MINSVIPKNFDRNYLAPLYEKIYKKYQEAAPGNIMFFEPGQFGDILGVFGGLVFNVGF